MNKDALFHKITDINEAMKVIMDQPGIALNDIEFLNNDSKIALANALNQGLEYAAKKEEELKHK